MPITLVKVCRCHSGNQNQHRKGTDNAMTKRKRTDTSSCPKYTQQKTKHEPQ